MSTARFGGHPYMSVPWALGGPQVNKSLVMTTKGRGRVSHGEGVGYPKRKGILGGTLPCDIPHDACDLPNPPPPNRMTDRQKDTYENITFPQIRLWALTSVIASGTYVPSGSNSVADTQHYFSVYHVQTYAQLVVVDPNYRFYQRSTSSCRVRRLRCQTTSSLSIWFTRSRHATRSQLKMSTIYRSGSVNSKSFIGKVLLVSLYIEACRRCWTPPPPPQGL